MKSFIEIFKEHVHALPRHPIVFDEIHIGGITYKQLDEFSGRVYAYLKQHGIGKEDFVLINMPRSAAVVIVMLGVWKAGAAFVVVEDSYTPERIAYIDKDCRCKLTIDKAIMEEISKYEPHPGYEEAGPHDAAFAVYTSGTTGNPKGVLHEYGNIMRCAASLNYDGELILKKGERFALLSPLSFIASKIAIIGCLYGGCSLYLAPYKIVKNPVAFRHFLQDNRISISFITPSYLRVLKGQISPYLQTIIVGSESAHGVYMENARILNFYALSESCFIVSIFKIDRSYDVCPIGRPQFDLSITLLTEEGTPAKDGEMGELCFDNPYVRGYINLPGETKKAFTGDLFHSGDLAKRLPSGSFLLVGRSNDMIKINGNRIEPAEIEKAVKEVLGIEWAAAKGFEDGHKAYVSVYYTADIEVDAEMLRKRLLRHLPYYMIPAYFVKIDQIPSLPNGKLDKKALPAPKIEDYRTAYEPPVNEIEKRLCRAFQKILKLNKVSVNDDYYELGGNSLSSMQVIVESALPGLTTSEIFKGRTVRKIAALYRERHTQDSASDEEKNAAAMELPHALTSEQLYMIDYQLYTPMSTMYNLFTMLKMDKAFIDIGRFAAAVKTAVKNHPALLTTFSFNEDGEMQQTYTPDIMPEIKVEKLYEQELALVKDTLVKPYILVNSCMFRCRIFETENAGYLFFDVHHSLFDGISFKVFIGNVVKAYLGMSMEPDYYYLMLSEREKDLYMPDYELSKQYFEARYNGDHWATHPRTDHQSRCNEAGRLTGTLAISQEEMRRMEETYQLSRNEFFIVTAALAISFYNDAPDVKLSWIYNGRENVGMMTTVGLIFRDLPVAFHFEDAADVKTLYADVKDQVYQGILHSNYPYVAKNAPVVLGDHCYLLYQKDIRDIGGFKGIDFEMVDVRQNQPASQTVLDIHILDDVDGLRTMFDYAASRYDAENMTLFMDLFIRVAQLLVRHDAGKILTIKNIKEQLLIAGSSRHGEPRV